MQRRSAKGSIRLCTVLGDLVPMGFRASVCIYVIDTNCLPEGERIGSALCGCPTNSGGCCVGRTSERRSVGLEVRRRFYLLLHGSLVRPTEHPAEFVGQPHKVHPILS